MNNNTNSLFDEAVSLHQSGQLDQAKTLYNKILQESPEHADCLHLSGMLSAQQQDYQSAISQIQQALKIQPKSALYHNNLANAYQCNNEVDKAIEHYHMAIEINADYAEAYNNLGGLLCRQGQFDEALKYCAKATELQPDYIAAHHNLAVIFLQLNNIKAAIKEFNNVINLQPDAWKAHYQIANLHLLQNDLDLAEYHYREALKTEEHAPSLNNLGVVYLKREQNQKAIECFTHVLTIDENNLDAHNNIAATFIHHQRYQQAIAHYKILLEKQPDNEEAQYNIGVAKMALGQLSQAFEHFKKTIDLNPNHGPAQSNLGAIYLKQGKHKLAKQHFEQALKIDDNNHTVRFMLSALSGDKACSQAPQEFIKNLYNNYALYYDKHLQESLYYRVPQLIKSAIATTRGDNLDKKTLLDLGCGTGLAAEPFKDSLERIVGVDLSQAMLKVAEKKSIYDELINADIYSALDKLDESFDFIIAADVLIYTGDLKPFLEKAQPHLNEQGLLAITLEKTTKKNFLLQPTGRYAHNKTYVKSLAQELGYRWIACTEVIARVQDKEEVKEYLIILGPPGEAAPNH